MTRGPNYVSVVSYWEVVLKSMKGKLKVGDPRLWRRDTLDQLAALPLPLRPDHVSALAELAHIHQDPFDRALIAQARVEGLVFVTSERAILEYATKDFRVLS
jgi:PIN domain nuclease of toxin-antitoxin system